MYYSTVIYFPLKNIESDIFTSLSLFYLYINFLGSHCRTTWVLLNIKNQQKHKYIIGIVEQTLAAGIHYVPPHSTILVISDETC